MSTAADLPLLSIRDLAPRLARREVSPFEVTRAVLERIDRLGPALNTFISLTAEAALDSARVAEVEIRRGGYRGPLHGIPLGLKDLFDVAGLPTTAGSTILRDTVAQADADVVARLRQAGAVLLGKQSMHEFAYGITGENPHYGDTRNPWDPARVPGGSSSGTAAGVAAGLCYGGLGSDTGGSVRIPASFCGTVGLKPTYGAVSRRGVLPLAWSLDHVGPIARTAADVALLFHSIRDEPPPGDPLAGLDEGVAGLRLGVPREYFWDRTDPAVAAVVRAAIEHLASLGAEVQEVSLPRVSLSPAASTAVMGTEAAAWHAAWLRDETMVAQYGADVLLRLRTGALTLGTDYLHAQQTRSLIQQDFLQAFAQVDVLVAPTTALVAPERGKTFEPSGWLNVPPRTLVNRLTVPANVSGMPALSVPCGFVEGLPVGLQVLGPPHGEPTILRLAHAYETSARWCLVPPLAA